MIIARLWIEMLHCCSVLSSTTHVRLLNSAALHTRVGASSEIPVPINEAMNLLAAGIVMV